VQFECCKYALVIEIDTWKWNRLHVSLFELFKVCLLHWKLLFCLIYCVIGNLVIGLYLECNKCAIIWCVG